MTTRARVQLHLSDSSADADEESPKFGAAVLLLEEMVSHAHDFAFLPGGVGP